MHETYDHDILKLVDPARVATAINPLLGVVDGGDLQTGLPLQSLHDGSQWRHEPLRLSVMLEASREEVDAILDKHASVAELVDNGWIHLFALAVVEAKTWKYLHRSNWVDFAAQA